MFSLTPGDFASSSIPFWTTPLSFLPWPSFLHLDIFSGSLSIFHFRYFRDMTLYLSIFYLLFQFHILWGVRLVFQRQAPGQPMTSLSNNVEEICVYHCSVFSDVSLFLLCEITLKSATVCSICVTGLSLPNLWWKQELAPQINGE